MLHFYRVKLRVQEYEDAHPHGAQVFIGASTEDIAIGMAIDQFSGADIIEPYYVEEVYPTSMIISQVYFH